jgi:NAD(P)-dependent dehydrogenase (short-subunit alcohol dehydrogenase family)
VSTANNNWPKNPYSCDGKVALVTGASSGIGVTVARVLSDLGATVAVAARRLDRLEAVANDLRDGWPFQTDLSTASGNSNLVDAVHRKFGKIDIVVANAGISTVLPALHETEEQFSEQLSMNVLGPFSLFRQAATYMKQARTGGSLIAISSVVAHRVQAGVPSVGYTASKSAVRGLVGELAVQWARYQIRVNAISPGIFPTEMTADAIASPEWMERTTQSIPLRRIGDHADLYGPIALLATDAGSYITGQSLVVDGGWSL